ncbi:hypothetical protein, partial [Streptomyces albidoflavus]|uniref:hypothetical protein n=1 Tax=Streptomyces albidoflavus TaxID=1886 RepID=UPI0015C6A209
VIAIARKIRAERLENFQYEPAEADETPRQYLARLRGQISDVAPGTQSGRHASGSPPSRAARRADGAVRSSSSQGTRQNGAHHHQPGAGKTGAGSPPANSAAGARHQDGRGPDVALWTTWLTS